jgi:hypothetical protein
VIQKNPEKKKSEFENIVLLRNNINLDSTFPIGIIKPVVITTGKTKILTHFKAEIF